MAAERLKAPFTVHNTDGAYWVQDANETRFGYCYFQDPPLIGTGSAMSRQQARRVAKWIARQATAWATAK